MSKKGKTVDEAVSRRARGARRKGHSFEREVAALFRTIFPHAKRHLEYQDGEANGVDLTETGRYRIQCKKMKKYAPITCLFEVQADRPLGDIPVLITAGDNLEPMAILPLSDFISLVAQSESTETKGEI